MTKPVTDNFQPINLINAMRAMLKTTRDSPDMEDATFREGVMVGLAYAICEIKLQAEAKDRFTPYKDKM